MMKRNALPRGIVAGVAFFLLGIQHVSANGGGVGDSGVGGTGDKHTTLGSPALSCHMTVPAKVKVGQRVPLVFVIRNHTAKALRVLTWNTPLEGMIGRPLNVTGPKGEVEYRGPMIKRGAATAENYLRIAPDGKSQKTIDLATGYDLSAPGRYTVAFTNNLHDVTTDKVPRAMDAHVSTPLTCEAVSFEILAAR
jgi:peptidyl-Lys metalloendopeptidase